MNNNRLRVALYRIGLSAEQVERDVISETAQLFDNFERMCQQSADTKDGKLAEPPPRKLAPLIGNEFCGARRCG